MKLNKENLKLFWKYVTERHNIYKKKKAGQVWPWTNDKILQTYKFTNVFRDLDSGTKYVIEKIILKSKTPENVIFNTIIYRIYNKINTSEKVGIQDAIKFDATEFEDRLRSIKDKVFTNAFIVSGYSFIEGKDKIAKTCKIINDVHSQIKEITESILLKNSENTFKTLKSIIGIGNFLAYQIAVDLGYWDREVFDESKFVVAGPGCKSGIDWLFESREGVSYEECIAYLCDIQKKGFEDIKVNINELFSDRKEKRLNLMAMENCLCEISKYLKALNGEGRPRNKYHKA
ncbi:MAG: nucleotide kinase domain-containing protein [Nanoarchaeota archaeon]